MDVLHRVVVWESGRMSRLAMRAGATIDSGLAARRSAARGFRASVVSVPVALAAGVFLAPAAFALVFAPVVFFFMDELRLKDAAAKRREDIERALPFFCVLVNVLGGAGMSLYSIFEGLAGKEFFAAIQREAAIVVRDVRVFGMDTNQALERLAATHPSSKLRAFLNGYTTKVRSGGDVTTYLADESGAMMRDLEGAWSRYAARSGVVGSLMVTVFGVLPLLLMIVGVFSPGASVLGLVLFTGVAVPVFTVVLVAMAGRMQPANDSPVRGNLVRSIAAGSACGAVVYLVAEPWSAVAVGMIGLFLSYGLSVRARLTCLRQTDEALPRFMDDVLEFKRQEYSLTKAVPLLASETSYNRAFATLLKDAAAQVNAGVALDEVRLHTDSTLAKTAFFLLGQMERSGGGTVETVYTLANHTRMVSEMKSSTRAEMRPYLILAYVAPLLLAFGVTLVRGVLSSLGGSFRLGLSGASVPALQVGGLPPLLSQVSDLLIIVSAASLGIIGAKMTDFTVRSTLKASLNVGVAATALALLSSPSTQAALRAVL